MFLFDRVNLGVFLPLALLPALRNRPLSFFSSLASEYPNEGPHLHSSTPLGAPLAKGVSARRSSSSFRRLFSALAPFFAARDHVIAVRVLIDKSEEGVLQGEVFSLLHCTNGTLSYSFSFVHDLIIC